MEAMPNALLIFLAVVGLVVLLAVLLATNSNPLAKSKGRSQGMLGSLGMGGKKKSYGKKKKWYN